MDKKTISQLKPVIRALGQDVKTVKATFDALRSCASVKTEATDELIFLVDAQFRSAIRSMKVRLDEITRVAGELAERTEGRS